MGATHEELVQRIFEACAELSRLTGRRVSPDGHLVGSLGEIYAASVLNLTLETASNAGFDATDSNGQRVEVKTLAIRLSLLVPTARPAHGGLRGSARHNK